MGDKDVSEVEIFKDKDTWEIVIHVGVREGYLED